MVYSDFIMNKINKSLVVGVLLLAVIVPMTTWLAVRNQETRSNAASDSSTDVVTTTSEVDVDGECGDMDGQVVSAAPDNRYACNKGAVNWMDSKADDGIYNWDCIGTKEGIVTHCTATLEK